MAVWKESHMLCWALKIQEFFGGNFLIFSCHYLARPSGRDIFRILNIYFPWKMFFVDMNYELNSSFFSISHCDDPEANFIAQVSSQEISIYQQSNELWKHPRNDGTKTKLDSSSPFLIVDEQKSSLLLISKMYQSWDSIRFDSFAGQSFSLSD